MSTVPASFSKPHWWPTAGYQAKAEFMMRRWGVTYGEACAALSRRRRKPAAPAPVVARLPYTDN